MDCNGYHFLCLSERCKQHVIDEHFIIESSRRIERKKSFFFVDVFSPQELFKLVEETPRFQMEQGGWSGDEYIYWLMFDRDIGVRPSSASTTNAIKIVCGLSPCVDCGVHTRTKVITIYPGFPED